MSRVFISYGHEDLAVALELYDALLSAGHTPWLDKRDLLPGEHWSERISDEIQKADFFVLLLSRRSFTRRGFLQKELRLAMEVLDQVPPDQRFLIPVLLDDFRPSHATLRQLHWFDLTQDRSTRIACLITSLGSRESAAAQLFAEARIVIPSDIGDWDDVRLFSFIDNVLWPEAWYLAHSDYPSQFPTADTSAHIQALQERTWEKLHNAALEHGFTNGLIRYRQYHHKHCAQPADG
jgi:hypothetical protein